MNHIEIMYLHISTPISHNRLFLMNSFKIFGGQWEIKISFLYEIDAITKRFSLKQWSCDDYKKFIPFGLQFLTSHRKGSHERKSRQSDRISKKYFRYFQQ